MFGCQRASPVKHGFPTCKKKPVTFDNWIQLFCFLNFERKIPFLIVKGQPDVLLKTISLSPATTLHIVTCNGTEKGDDNDEVLRFQKQIFQLSSFKSSIPD